MKPRLGFLGVGWIGRHRLQALVQSNVAEVVAIADPVEENLVAAEKIAPSTRLATLEQLLELPLDGVVIATPSAQHAEQALAALESDLAVFCQKPLARTAAETAEVVAAARSRDRLLGVDLSYRHVEGAQRIRRLIQSGELGSVYTSDLVFHNAYGPDKPWFYDPALSGGGCVIDLGIHLVDLALWLFEHDSVVRVSSRLYSGGRLLEMPPEVVEDFGLASLELRSGATIRLACSWNLPAGRDAVIQASFFGTRGGAMLSNVNGSFYDFLTERFQGTSRDVLCTPPDAWGGRAIVEWATRLAQGAGYDPAAEHLVEVAGVIDAIYGRAEVTVPRLEHSRAVLAAGAGRE